MMSMYNYCDDAVHFQRRKCSTSPAVGVQLERYIQLRTIKEDLLLQTIEESIGCEVNAENAGQIQRVVITKDDIVVEKKET